MTNVKIKSCGIIKDKFILYYLYLQHNAVL
jgi:hypothetical protein